MGGVFVLLDSDEPDKVRQSDLPAAPDRIYLVEALPLPTVFPLDEVPETAIEPKRICFQRVGLDRVGGPRWRAWYRQNPVMVAVAAETQADAIDWARKAGLQPFEFRYLSDPLRVRGQMFTHWNDLHCWWLHRHADEIRRERVRLEAKRGVEFEEFAR